MKYRTIYKTFLALLFTIFITFIFLVPTAFSGDKIFKPPKIEKKTMNYQSIKKGIGSGAIKKLKHVDGEPGKYLLKATKKVKKGMLDTIFGIGIAHAKPTPIYLDSADEKAGLLITDWGLDCDATVGILNPDFGSYTGFFTTTCWRSGVGYFNCPDLATSPCNFYGKVTAVIIDTIMDNNSGVVQGGANMYKSTDSDGQWQNGWVSLDGTEASFPISWGGTVYGLPNCVFIGPALGNDDRSKQLAAAYTNDEKGYLMIRANAPDIGGINDFEFLESGNVWFGTAQGKRAGNIYPISFRNEEGGWINPTTGIVIQGWIYDSALASSVASFEAKYDAFAWPSKYPFCAGVSLNGSWTFTRSPYHESIVSGLGFIYISYSHQSCP